MSGVSWAGGAAYVDGRYMPVEQAAIPIMDWGYRRSDVTYDVVGVWGGAFFRLNDHIARFRSSMNSLRLAPTENNDDIRAILAECVRRTGLREAYVGMDCLRGTPQPGQPRHPSSCRNYIVAFSIPWVWVITPENQARGAHLIVAATPRIPDASVDPRVKNFHWADMTRGLFEAQDQGAENCILLDQHGLVTEGPGFNVFVVQEGRVATPDRGVLEGITRRSVAELCDELGLPFTVRPVHASELQKADEIFLSTTAGGIMPVSRLNDRIFCNDRPGPISSRLRETFWAKRTQGWHATPIDYDR